MGQLQTTMSAHYHEQLYNTQQAHADLLARKDSAFEELKAHGLRAAAESSNYARLNRFVSHSMNVMRYFPPASGSALLVLTL